MTDNLQEKNQQVLNNISQLQTQEKQLYDSLEDASLSSEQKKQLIDKINEISQMRMNMYAGLKDTYVYYQKNTSTSQDMLKQQVTAIDILENQLNDAKKRMNMIEDQKYNKLRLIQINTYYGKRYNTHSKLMKTIALMCVPLIILGVLANKGILPSNIYVVLSGLVIVIGLVMVGLQIVDISNRDNMNWDEYNWYFDQESAPTESTDEVNDTTESSDPWSSTPATCVGSACCYDGSIYDEEQNICIPNGKYNEVQEEEEEVTEAFKGLDKYGYTQNKVEYVY